MPIRTRVGAHGTQSEFAARPWIYGAEDLNVYHGFSDDAVVIDREPVARTTEENFAFSYIA